MKKTKRVTRIVETLDNLNKNDIYSMLLFTLFKLKDDPKYSTLSELCYVLDGKNLPQFLKYYGGLTITIPTLRDLRLVTQGLLLYQYANLEEEVDFKKALDAVCGDEFTADEVKEVYSRIIDVINNYNFDRGVEEDE